ncbi:MAG TPA: glycosyltransferase family 2 protein [Planctomycetota bacterium]|nr:glycosyltransferase family 2 protein [Planctomycetota bacterium]
MAELSVLIVNYNSWRECATAIATLRQHGPKQRDGSPMPFECIVVDNLSPRRDPVQIAAVEHELALLCEQQRDPLAGRLVMHTENGGYAKGMNVAFRHSRGRWILVSNPDVLFLPGLIERLQRHLERDAKAGCVVPKGFWDPECTGRLPPNTLPTLGDILFTTWGEFSHLVSQWHARRLARRWLAVWNAEQPIALPMMSGCLFLIERSFFESLGLFDERFPLYYEDTDLSVKIRRAGRNVVQVPDAHLVHFVNRSGMTDEQGLWKRHHTSRRLYYEKWYGRLGTWALRASQWLLSAKPLQRLRRFRFPTPLVDLGESARPPVLELGRQCERFLVLLSLDARFYLAAGLIGSGARWTPSPAAFDLFVAATWYFAAYDLTGGRFERIGTWRYTCLSHLGVPVPSTAAAKPTAALSAEGP